MKWKETAARMNKLPGMVKITTSGREKDMEIRETNKKLVSENLKLKGQIEKLMSRVEALEASGPINVEREVTVNVTTANKFDALTEDEGVAKNSQEAQPNDGKKDKTPDQGSGKKQTEHRPVAQMPYNRRQEELQMAKAKTSGNKNKDTTAEVSGETTNVEKPPAGPKFNGRVKVDLLKADVVVSKLAEQNVKVFLNQINRTQTMISCCPKDREYVCNTLVQTGHKGHSFQTKEDRAEKRLLKGVNGSFGPVIVKEAITEKLEEMNIPYGKFEVDAFVTYHSAVNGIVLPFYMVTAQEKETMDLITSIEGLCHTRNITWDELYKSEITQCFNCYKFGHSQKGRCFHDTVCKKCGKKGDHECTVETLPQYDENGKWQNIYANYICCNCSTKDKTVYGHPPTWSGCEYYKTQLENARAAKKRRLDEKEKKYRNKHNTHQGTTYEEAKRPEVNAWAQRAEEQRAQQKADEPRAPPKTKRTQVEYGDVGDTSRQAIDLEQEILNKMGISCDALQDMAEKFIAKYSEATTLKEQKKQLAIYFLNVNNWCP